LKDSYFFAAFFLVVFFAAFFFVAMFRFSCVPVLESSAARDAGLKIWWHHQNAPHYIGRPLTVKRNQDEEEEEAIEGGAMFAFFRSVRKPPLSSAFTYASSTVTMSRFTRSSSASFSMIIPTFRDVCMTLGIWKVFPSRTRFEIAGMPIRTS
jgi:hypothetical protein